MGYHIFTKGHAKTLKNLWMCLQGGAEIKDRHCLKPPDQVYEILWACWATHFLIPLLAGMDTDVPV